MSMDTRVPNGIMSAWSLGHDSAERVFVSFQPFATTGSGPEATGQMFRMEQIISSSDADHDVKDQYFTPSSSTPTKWLAKRYSYTRRPARPNNQPHDQPSEHEPPAPHRLVGGGDNGLGQHRPGAGAARRAH